jgi:hypothetical protein
MIPNKTYAALFLYHSLRGDPKILMQVIDELSMTQTNEFTVFLNYLSELFLVYNKDCSCSNKDFIPKNNDIYWRDDLK